MPQKKLMGFISYILKKILGFFRNKSSAKSYQAKNNENSTQNFNQYQEFNKFDKYDEIKTKNNAKSQGNKLPDASVEQLSQKSGIKPDSFKQRNLDLEVGGLEAEEQKEISSKDIWDDRSEEVDRMALEGAKNSLNTTGKRSMLWRLKKKKMDKEELQEEIAEIAEKMNKSHASKVQQQRQNNNNNGRSL